MGVRAERLLVRETKSLRKDRNGIVVGADFAEPRTIAQLAEEHRQSMAAIREPLQDVDLPQDD